MYLLTIAAIAVKRETTTVTWEYHHFFWQIPYILMRIVSRVILKAARWLVACFWCCLWAMGMPVILSTGCYTPTNDQPMTPRILSPCFTKQPTDRNDWSVIFDFPKCFNFFKLFTIHCEWYIFLIYFRNVFFCSYKWLVGWFAQIFLGGSTHEAGDQCWWLMAMVLVNGKSTSMINHWLGFNQ